MMVPSPRMREPEIFISPTPPFPPCRSLAKLLPPPPFIRWPLPLCSLLDKPPSPFEAPYVRYIFS